LEVRSKEENLEKHILLAEHVPLERMKSWVYKPTSGKVMVPICSKGGECSERAANYLRKNFSNAVYFLKGGTKAWCSIKKIV